MEENLSNIIILKWHNKVTEARYDMSALAKDILYMAMAQLRDNDPVGKTYFISIEELKESMEKIGQEITLQLIFEATRELITVDLEFEDFNRGKRLSVNLFSSINYTIGSDSIRLKFAEMMHPYFFNLEVDVTSYQFGSARSLRSKYSKRIYEMLSQHKEAGIFKISVLKLKERLNIIDPVTEDDKHKSWSSFSRDVLELSKREINKKTDLSFTYTLTKTGNKYTDIEFHITKKENIVPKEGRQAQLEFQL
jgi:plasmid replication initiation protein